VKTVPIIADTVAYFCKSDNTTVLFNYKDLLLNQTIYNVSIQPAFNGIEPIQAGGISLAHNDTSALTLIFD